MYAVRRLAVSKTVYKAACGCDLRHPAKAVLKEMAWFADEDGRNIWPSVKTLAGRTGLSRRAIQKILRNLEEIGVIRGFGSRLGGRNRLPAKLGQCSSALLERTQPLRPFSPVKKQNSELQNHERADRESQNGEPRSPNKNEQEYEKNVQPFPQRTEENQQALKPEPKAASPYEHQRLRQRVRKDARGGYPYHHRCPNDMFDRQFEGQSEGQD